MTRAQSAPLRCGWSVFLWSLLATCSIGCDASGRATAGDPRKVAPIAACASEVGYPPARWRLDPASVNHVAFQLQRIVVAYGPSDEEEYWWLDDRGAGRSEEQARLFAQRLACALQDDPERFDELARRYSNDRVTRAFGGHMGLVRATSFAEEIVDALDRIQEGEVSNVIPTPAGFQIVRRLAVRPAMQVSALKVWFSTRGEEGTPASRDEVAAAARHFAEQARSQPDRFAELAADGMRLAPEASEDFGEHSTHEADSNALLLHALSEADLGGIVGPVETEYGFAVLRREPLRPRNLYAMREMVVLHRTSRLPIPKDELPARSAVAARAMAQQLLASVLSQPERFPDIQQDNCKLPSCEDPISFREGDVLQEIQHALTGVPEGAIVPYVVESRIGFHVLKREAPEHILDHESLAFEVPSPPLRDLVMLIEQAPGSVLAAFFREKSAGFDQDAGLDPRQRVAFAKWLDDCVRELAQTTPGPLRAGVIDVATSTLASLVGADAARQYRGFLDMRLRAAQLEFLTSEGIALGP